MGLYEGSINDNLVKRSIEVTDGEGIVYGLG